MARAPYFIRQLKISPDIVEGVYPVSFIDLQSFSLGNFDVFTLNPPSPFAIDPALDANNKKIEELTLNAKLRNEKRLLNLSNNLDSTRTYTWQVEFKFSNDDIVDDIPKFTLSAKQLEFPSYVKNKIDLGLYGQFSAAILGMTNDKTFRVTIQDLLVGTIPITQYLFTNKYITSDAALNEQLNFELRLHKYSTDGELFETFIFTSVRIFGYKLGTFDYTTSQMQEITLELIYESFISCTPEYSDSSVKDLQELYKIQEQTNSKNSNTIREYAPDKLDETSLRPSNPITSPNSQQ